VKNKAPAEIQITAEQLLREAKERDLEILPPPPKQKISDPDELADYQHRKRRAFEDSLRKNRTVISNWIKYAQWEESQKAVPRARSIYERALDVDHRNITLWLKYTEMEMRNRQVNHARNLWDRAVTILPRANQFWYKYTYMEEMVGNIAGARQVFDRWMEWEPDEQAWLTYIKFELRYKEIDRARGIYEKFVYVHPEVRNWIKFARFEEQHGFISGARKVFERAVEFFGEESMDEKLYISFAKFEEGQREHDRARVIYKYALDHIPKDRTQELYKAYTIHEKKYGDRTGIEDVIVSKRKFQYEEEKPFWRRYIYLWINYALFEELEAEDVDRTRQVYRACLELLPHKHFTFTKIWLLYAHYEIRNKNLTVARKTLFAELETLLGDVDRARAIYELAVNQPRLDMPELLWKAYIDFEVGLGETEKARELYERLLERTLHVKVWMSYAQFEMSAAEEESIILARRVYERANQSLRGANEKEERVLLLEAWRDFESQHGDEESVKNVMQKMPRRVKKRQRVQADDGVSLYISEEGWEEFFDYIFPEDEATKPNLKLLEMAKAWKKQQKADEESGESES
ncbi:Protein crooked neck, partial [Blattella germanica]